MPTPAPGREPYVGLAPYDSDDVDRFFGRARETWELDTLVFASRLVVVYGLPGVGKTSLLRAGLIPGLKPNRAQALPLVQLPRASALPTAPPADTNPFTAATLAAWASHATTDAAGEATTASGLLAHLPVRMDRYGEVPVPLIVIVDQVDELFRLGPEWATQRQEFLDDLERAANRIERLRLVLCTRNDTIGELLSFESRLVGGSRRRYRVEPLGRRAARAAVATPLEATNRRFSPDAAEQMVDRLMVTTVTDEVGERLSTLHAAVEPISLQVVCLSLWRSLPDDVTTITPEVVSEYFREQGDVDAILTALCVQAVIDVAARNDIDEPGLWSWLERTFVTDLGTRSAVYQGRASTGGMPHGVAQAFEEHRILRSEKRSGSLWFELVHDVLIEPIRRGRLVSEGLAADEGPRTGADAYLRMAKAALRAGHLALAEQYAWGVVRASDAGPGTLAEAHAFLGELVLDQGRTATGERAEELYLSAEDRFRRAAELFDTAQNTRAVSQQQAALGRLFMQRGRYADAVSEFRSALDRRRDVDIRLDFARALARFGHVHAARGEYTTALVCMPDEARDQRVEALVGRGVLAIDLGDTAAGLRDLDGAVRLRPELADRPDVVAARRAAVPREHSR